MTTVERGNGVVVDSVFVNATCNDQTDLRLVCVGCSEDKQVPCSSFNEHSGCMDDRYCKRTESCSVGVGRVDDVQSGVVHNPINVETEADCLLACPLDPSGFKGGEVVGPVVVTFCPVKFPSRVILGSVIGDLDVGSCVGVASLEPGSENSLSSAPPPGPFHHGRRTAVGKIDVSGVCQCTDFRGLGVGVVDVGSSSLSLS